MITGYEIHLTGGTLGEIANRKNPVRTYTAEQKALAMEAKRQLNNSLTAGEKKHYKMKYVLKTIKSQG